MRPTALSGGDRAGESVTEGRREEALPRSGQIGEILQAGLPAPSPP